MAVVALDERVEAADQSAGAAEHQTEADEPVARGADAEVHHVLHQNIAGVLCTGETGFTQGEARLHEVDEERSHERPTGVDGAEHNFLTSPRCVAAKHQNPAARAALLMPIARRSVVFTVQKALYSSRAAISPKTQKALAELLPSAPLPSMARV